MPLRRRKKILHIGVGNVYGGVETVITTLARHRDLCPDLELEFALCFDGRLADALRATGATVHLIQDPRIRTFWLARRHLRNTLRERQIDGAVLHAPWIYTLLAPAVRAARLPAILIHYDPADGRRWHERLLSPGKPVLAIAISKAAAESLPSLFSGVRCEIIYVPAELAGQPTLSAAERAAVRAGLSTAPDAIVVLQVGRMEPYKGHRVNLQALLKLTELPNLVCWFAGPADLDYEQQYLDGLKAEAARLGITDRVRFIGYYDDIPRLLAAADIYCQPNTGREGFGLTFIEALWARLPVIGTPLSGVIDILEDEYAMIVPPGDVKALAEAIRKLAGDPDLRTRMGSAGPARVMQYCYVERQVKRLSDAILTAVENPARPSRLPWYYFSGTTSADDE